MEGGVTAIVLAAGESRRMGALKPLLPYGCGSVIQAVVRSLKASPVDRVLVVLGHRSEEIARNLAGEGVELVDNPRYREGMLASIQAGVAAAAPETAWLLIALGDQPSLRPETVAQLLDTARRARQEGQTESLFVPFCEGRRGHPLLIHAEHRREIAELDPAVGLRELLRRHPARILHVPIAEDAVLRDMDTPEEYEQELARLRSRSGSPAAEE